MAHFIESDECPITAELGVPEIVVDRLLPLLPRVEVHGNLYTSETIVLTWLNLLIVKSLVTFEEGSRVHAQPSLNCGSSEQVL